MILQLARVTIRRGRYTPEAGRVLLYCVSVPRAGDVPRGCPKREKDEESQLVTICYYTFSTPTSIAAFRRRGTHRTFNERLVWKISGE